jgi:ATP-dependent RNA helicase DDX35
MRCQLGQDVGYSIRFDDVTSASTRIKFLTDGLLLREALADPLLSRYSVIIIDEAHERSLSSDILLGLLKKIIKRRPELRVIISSATLQAEDFLEYFETRKEEESAEENANRIVSIEGRLHPVDIYYLGEPTEDYIASAVEAVFEIHNSQPAGDILIFLTGRSEIETVIQMIYDRMSDLPEHASKMLALPLYAGLTTEEQMYVFEPAPENTRKVICATNIAEASVTVDGIVYVIDCGFVKLKTFSPTTRIEELVSTPVSKASADQRAGRAGRTAPGKCYRLYTEDDSDDLAAATVPEIQRSNLSQVILQLKALGIDNIARFDFISPPPVEQVTQSLEILFSLGLLDEYARLTKPFGVQLAEMALEPMLGKCLLLAPNFGCLSEVLSITAMISLQDNIWLDAESKKAGESSRRLFAVEEGDHLTLLNIYQAFTTRGSKDASWCRQHFLNYKSLVKAVSIRAQLKRHLERFGVQVSESLANNDVLRVGGLPKAESIRRCLTSGYFAHAARMESDGSFKAVNGSTIMYAHPSSLMFNRKADWVIFSEVMHSGEKIYIRNLTKIEKNWLVEYGAGFYKLTQTT